MHAHDHFDAAGLFIILLSSSDRFVAIATASMSIERKPCDSSSCMALMVVPPGVVT